MTTEQTYEALDYLGFGTAMLSISHWIMESMDLATINEGIQTFVGLGGAVWVVHKIIYIRQQTKGERLDNRKKELEIQFKEEQNERTEEDI